MSYITYEVLVFSNGDQFWKNNYGRLHREDGPAVIRTNGTQSWYKDGNRHREDGPAIVGADGSLAWYKDGYLHREDGPAIIHANGEQDWYLNGNELTEQIFLEKTRPVKELTIAEIEKLLGHRVKVVGQD